MESVVVPVFKSDEEVKVHQADAENEKDKKADETVGKSRKRHYSSDEDYDRKR